MVVPGPEVAVYMFGGVPKLRTANGDDVLFWRFGNVEV